MWLIGLIISLIIIFFGILALLGGKDSRKRKYSKSKEDDYLRKARELDEELEDYDYMDKLWKSKDE
ncbi:MAG: hypothetical protein KJ893_03670 [Candidatus Omnitrophica bacterium]|nr:hypothetical protein [Candidatus Omnitrophota bacterium]